MTWNSYPLMSNLGSNNGTVIMIDKVWIGSGHGNEVDQSKSLLVDGVPTAITDGATYSGEIIKFIRKTTLDDAFRLTSTMTITTNGTDEQVVLEGLDSAKTVNRMAAYGFLGTRANLLTQYAAFDSKGKLLSSGAIDRDDNVQHPRMNSAVAVAQYDPAAQKGILSQVIEGVDLGPEPFIWDRSADNKLYFAFSGIGGQVAVNNHYKIKQIVTPFEAAPDSWKKAAGAMVITRPAR